MVNKFEGIIFFISRFFVISIVFLLFSISVPNSYALNNGSWESLGLSNYTITNLAIDPVNSEVLYATTSNSGIFKSTDGGSSWSNINNGLPMPVLANTGTIIVSDPSNSNILYAGPFSSQGTGLPGVYKTIDGGTSWTRIDSGIPWPGLLDMAIDPTNHSNLYMGIYGHCGAVWRSSNAGASWLQSVPDCDIFSMLIDPKNSNIIYAASDQSVFKSYDGALTWTDPSSHGIQHSSDLAIDPNDSLKIYAATSTGLYKSSNGGVSWASLSNSPSGGFGRHSLITDPSRLNSVYVGTTEVFKSDDGGDSWISISNGLPHSQIYSLLIPKDDTSKLYAATDGGVYVYGLGDDSSVSLNVPIYKQTDTLWGSEIFDHAGSGQFDCGSTMYNCGCSTTSIAMLLRYYNVNKLPDGLDLNPGTLNMWLKNNNGYNRNLGVIWPIAGSVAHKAKDKNPLFEFDSIEYLRGMTDKNQLADDIKNKMPVILEEPNHYVVAKGIEGNTFSINDPFNSIDSLDSNKYNNTFLSTRRYIPANSDLSYVVYVVDKDVDITVRNSNGSNVGYSYLEYPVEKQLITPQSIVTDPSLKIFELPKPASGIYKIELSSNSVRSYRLDQYVITQGGDNKMDSLSGYLGKNINSIFSLNYDKQIIGNNIVKPVVSFEKLKFDLQELFDQENIDNKGILNSLMKKIDSAIKAYDKGVSKDTLNSFINDLKAQRGKHVNEDAYQILYNESSSLIMIL